VASVATITASRGDESSCNPADLTAVQLSSDALTSFGISSDTLRSSRTESLSSHPALSESSQVKR
jgi:hypothetical protein